jgi:hypothetical protein
VTRRLRFVGFECVEREGRRTASSSFTADEMPALRVSAACAARGHPRLRRALGDAEDLRDLDVRLSLEVREVDARPLLLGELLHRRPHSLADPERAHRFVEIGGRHRGLRCHGIGSSPRRLFSTHAIDSPAVRSIPSQAPALAESSALAPRSDTRTSCDVLAAAGSQTRQATQHREANWSDPREGGLVAGGDPLTSRTSR